MLAPTITDRNLSFWRLKSIRRVVGVLVLAHFHDCWSTRLVTSKELLLWNLHSRAPQFCTFLKSKSPPLQAKLPEHEQMKSNEIVSAHKFMKTNWKALKRHKELGNAERNSIERTFSAVWIDLHPFIPLAFLRSDVSEGYIQVPASIRRQPFSQAGWRDLISHFSDCSCFFAVSRVSSRTT